MAQQSQVGVPCSRPGRLLPEGCWFESNPGSTKKALHVQGFQHLGWSQRNDVTAYFLPQAPPLAGDTNKANCFGQSVAALNRAFGNQPAAAAALGYASVDALHDASREFCNS
jgi:hypothetical protein